MLSGRRAVDKNRPTGEHNLVEWARPYLTNKRKIFRVLDSRLEGQYSMDGAQKVASLAFQCLSTEGRLRPSMDEVVAVLEQLQDKKSHAASKTQAEPKMHTQSFGSGSQRPRVRTLEECPSAKVPYPRPLASPLYE